MGKPRFVKGVLVMIGFDDAITRAVNSPAGHAAILDHFMIAISTIGVPVLIILVAIQWWRKADRLHVRSVIVSSGLSFLLGLALNQLILLLVHRVRPYDVGVTHLIVAKSADPSFPSDHATATAAIAAAFLLHGMRRTGLWFALGALVIAYSRVYIGIHYAGDVLGGTMMGVLAAIVVLALYPEGSKLDRVLTTIL